MYYNFLLGLRVAMSLADMPTWIMSYWAIWRLFWFMEGSACTCSGWSMLKAWSMFVSSSTGSRRPGRSWWAPWNEAVKINGAYDFDRRDLWDAINQETFRVERLQLFDDQSPTGSLFDLVPDQGHSRGGGPVRWVGRLVLDRVVDNFFAETEQVAFCTENVVLGIDFTNGIRCCRAESSPTSRPSSSGGRTSPTAGQRAEVPCSRTSSRTSWP